MKVIFECTEVKQSTDFSDEKLNENIIMIPAIPQKGNPISKNETPNGRIRFIIDNPDSFGFYKVGFQYTIDVVELIKAKQPQRIQDFIDGKDLSKYKEIQESETEV